jgi:hypothetical protein
MDSKNQHDRLIGLRGAMAHVFIVALIAAFALAFGFALVAFGAAVRDVGSDLARIATIGN